MYVADNSISQFKIKMGVSVENAFRVQNKKIMDEEVENIFHLYESQMFIIATNIDLKEINIILNENIKGADMIEAYVRAAVAAHYYSPESKVSP